MKNRLLTLAMLVAAFLTGACDSPATWRYHPFRDTAIGTPRGGEIAIRPFEDQRPDGYSRFDLLALIPGFPFAFSDMDTPELNPNLLVDVKRDFPEALATQLKATNMFKDVYLSTEQVPRAEYVVTGQVVSTRLRLYRFTYFTGFLSYTWIPYALGLPKFYWEQEVYIKINVSKGGKTIFNGSIDSKADSWCGLYVRSQTYEAQMRTLEQCVAKGIERVLPALVGLE